jgi:hypothetical protein
MISVEYDAKVKAEYLAPHQAGEMQLQTLQPVLRSWHQKLDSNAIGIRGNRKQQQRPANGRPCP